MPGDLILPSYLEAERHEQKLKEVNEQNREQLFHRVWGKFAADIDHPDKHRHALTHLTCSAYGGWATPKSADWCPQCNGTMQREFQEYMAAEKKKKDEAEYAEFLENMKPHIDAARAEGKLVELLPGEEEPDGKVDEH